MMYVAIAAIVAFAVQEWRIRDHDKRAHDERLFLLEQAERERKELTTKIMARDLADYRTTVVTEAQAKNYEDPRVKQYENHLDAAYGPEWRNEV